VRKMARSTENSKRRLSSKAVRTLSIEQACQSRWKIRAGPILALRVAILSPRAWAPRTASFSENRPSDWISESSRPLASNSTSALSPPVVKRSGRSRPPSPARSHYSRRSSESPGISPRPLSPEDDHRLQDELRRKDDLYSNALLLTRLSGIRIGECIHLPLDCLRQIGPEQWTLHVPLGKLHTGRLVPLDSEGLRLLKRIQELRAMASPARLSKSKDFLLLRVGGRFALFQTLRLALADAATRAGCTDTKPISLHRLRHIWATDLLNCGIGLPALMKLMGHKSIQMTLRYLKVAQPDLQRKFYRARQNSPQSYSLPSLSVSTVVRICLVSAKRSRRRAIYWRCIGGNSPMTRPAGVYSGSITGS